MILETYTVDWKLFDRIQWNVVKMCERTNTPIVKRKSTEYPSIIITVLIPTGQRCRQERSESTSQLPNYVAKFGLG